MKTTKLTVLSLMLSAAAFAQTNWGIDASHTNIGFSVSHMMVSETKGKFGTFEGSVTSTKDDFSDSQIEFTVDIASVNTADEKRDGHLKSADFFDAANHPKMTFKSSSFKKTGDKKYKITGQLTIKGVSKTVELDAELVGVVKNPFTGATTAGFKLTGNINRVDYGLKWNVPLETGGVLVGEAVKIECIVELIKK